MKIQWNKISLLRLEEIHRFIAIDSPTRADDFILRLIESTDQLVEFPESGALIQEVQGVRHLVIDGYRIFYEIKNKDILIINVISPGRDVSY